MLRPCLCRPVGVRQHRCSCMSEVEADCGVAGCAGIRLGAQVVVRPSAGRLGFCCLARRCSGLRHTVMAACGPTQRGHQGNNNLHTYRQHWGSYICVSPAGVSHGCTNALATLPVASAAFLIPFLRLALM